MGYLSQFRHFEEPMSQRKEEERRTTDKLSASKIRASGDGGGGGGRQGSLINLHTFVFRGAERKNWDFHGPAVPRRLK